MTYDSAERVLTQTDPDGRDHHVHLRPVQSPSLAAGQTLITDPSGHKTLDTYSNGLLTSETKGYGSGNAGTWSYTYDPVTPGRQHRDRPERQPADLQLRRPRQQDLRLRRRRPDHQLRLRHRRRPDRDGRSGRRRHRQPVRPGRAHHHQHRQQQRHLHLGRPHLHHGDAGQQRRRVDHRQLRAGADPDHQLLLRHAADPADRTRSVDPERQHHHDDLRLLRRRHARSPIRSADKTLYGYDTARGWLTTTVSPNGTAAGVTATLHAAGQRLHHLRATTPTAT